MTNQTAAISSAAPAPTFYMRASGGSMTPTMDITTFTPYVEKAEAEFTAIALALASSPYYNFWIWTADCVRVCELKIDSPKPLVRRIG